MVFGPPYGPEGPALDAALLLKLMVEPFYWNLLFSSTFSAKNRWRIDSLRYLRNCIAHDQGDDPLFKSLRSALSFLESMEILLRAISTPEGFASLAKVKAISREIAPSPMETLGRLLSGRAIGSKRFWATGLVSIVIAGVLIDYYRSPKIRRERLVIGTPHQRLDNYRALETELEGRLKPYRLIDYLQGKRIDVILASADSYPKAVAELKALNWDVALAYSPIVSMSTIELGYRPIGVMFPDSKGYTSVIFTRQDSPIQNLADLQPDSKVALGDYYSATKYFVPMSLLKGKRVTLLPGLGVSEIFDLVRDGKADVGVAARSFEQEQPSDEFSPKRSSEGFRVIARGDPLPAALVALSPRLDDRDRDVLERVLMELPAHIRSKGQANYGPGAIPDYGRMERLVAEVRSFSACLKLDGGTLSIICPPELNIVAHELWIDDVSVAGTSVIFSATGINRQPMTITIERSLLDQLVSDVGLSALKGRHLEVLLPANATAGPHRILHPNQIEWLN